MSNSNPNRPSPWVSKAPLNFGAEGCSNLSSSMFKIETSAPRFVLNFSYRAPSRPLALGRKTDQQGRNDTAMLVNVTAPYCPFEVS